MDGIFYIEFHYESPLKRKLILLYLTTKFYAEIGYFNKKSGFWTTIALFFV